MKDDFIEKLASIEHDRWADWQRHCHIVLRGHCPSPELDKILARWDRQIALPYGELTEKEKESDREQVRRYLPFLKQLITSREKRVAEEILDEVDKTFSKLWIKLEEETPCTSEMTSKLNAVSMPFDSFLRELRAKYLT